MISKQTYLLVQLGNARKIMEFVSSDIAALLPGGQTFAVPLNLHLHLTYDDATENSYFTQMNMSSRRAKSVFNDNL